MDKSGHPDTFVPRPGEFVSVKEERDALPPANTIPPGNTLLDLQPSPPLTPSVADGLNDESLRARFRENLHRSGDYS